MLCTDLTMCAGKSQHIVLDLRDMIDTGLHLFSGNWQSASSSLLQHDVKNARVDTPDEAATYTAVRGTIVIVLRSKLGPSYACIAASISDLGLALYHNHRVWVTSPAIAWFSPAALPSPSDFVSLSRLLCCPFFRCRRRYECGIYPSTGGLSPSQLQIMIVRFALWAASAHPLPHRRE